CFPTGTSCRVPDVHRVRDAGGMRDGQPAPLQPVDMERDGFRHALLALFQRPPGCDAAGQVQNIRAYSLAFRRS
ncbi:MAG TPA: hypothetical protein VH744_03425, partial [Terriglobales bacterium]